MVAPWVMLRAPRQLLHSGVRAVETMTASGIFGPWFLVLGPWSPCVWALVLGSAPFYNQPHVRARRPRRPGSVARARRAVRFDDAGRLRRGGDQDRTAGR